MRITGFVAEHHPTMQNPIEEHIDRNPKLGSQPEVTEPNEVLYAYGYGTPDVAEPTVEIAQHTKVSGRISIKWREPSVYTASVADLADIMFKKKVSQEVESCLRRDGVEGDFEIIMMFDSPLYAKFPILILQEMLGGHSLMPVYKPRIYSLSRRNSDGTGGLICGLISASGSGTARGFGYSSQTCFEPNDMEGAQYEDVDAIKRALKNIPSL